MKHCMSMIVYIIGIFVLMALPLPILPVLNAGQEIIRIDEHFTESRTVYHFFQPEKIVELTLSGAINLFGNRSLVRVILVGDNPQEYLVYEAYPLIAEDLSMRIIGACEETCIMEGIVPKLIKIELINAAIQIDEIAISKEAPELEKKSLKASIAAEKDAEKIRKLNENIKKRRLKWVAGETSLSRLSYQEKKDAFGLDSVPNLQGFEFYAGGIFEIESKGADLSPLNNARSIEDKGSSLVDHFDWRNRHGANIPGSPYYDGDPTGSGWMTSAKHQGGFPYCWPFSTTGATEALTNLYFNTHVDLDLSEQDIISCRGDGGTINYLSTTGVVDEACFPYSGIEEPCENKCSDPEEWIQLGGQIEFVAPKTEYKLKRMLLDHGPLSGGIYSWNHAMTLVGYDKDRSDGETIWIFKNSYGTSWGENGYGYIKTDINNIGWTNAFLMPVNSWVTTREIACWDKDGDGYCNWGISAEKPAYCPAHCADEKDCDDSNAFWGSMDGNGHCIEISEDSWVWLGDISPVEATVGWDQYRVNKSWYQEGFDIANVHYRHGIFAHAPSRVVYNFDLDYVALSGCVGLDDGDGACGDGVVFHALQGGVEVYRSDIIASDHPAVCFKIPLNGGKKLELVVDELGDYFCDESVWANAKLVIDESKRLFYPRVDHEIQGGMGKSYGRSNYLAFGDLNEDGHLDLAVVGSSNAVVLLGTGDAKFKEPIFFDVGGNPTALAIDDVNGDEHLDIVAVTYVQGQYGPIGFASVLLGNGDGTFKDEKVYDAARGYYALASGDINGDDRPDLAIAGDGYVYILLNNGGGSFQAPVEYRAGGCGSTCGVALGDLNEDGHLDLAATDEGGCPFTVLMGNGDGTFQESQPHYFDPNVSYDETWHVAIADLNGDDHLDLAITDQYESYVKVVFGNGDGTFQNAVYYQVGGGGGVVSVGDLNGDGSLDLAIANDTTDNVLILLNNGDGTFQDALFFSAGRSPSAITIGDINEDGLPDLAVANAGDDNVSIFINKTGRNDTITPVIYADFNAGNHGFTYNDDPFCNTHHPPYASGDHASRKGYGGSGGLHAAVGNVDGKYITDGMSGGWSKDFHLHDASLVEISLKYRLMTTQYDADECGEALVALDGSLVMQLDKLCGRGLDTGWKTKIFKQNLSSGDHTLTVGAYNNKKTGRREKTDAYFDDISVRAISAYAPEIDCSNGIDDDGDNLWDCNDPDCADSGDCNELPYLSIDFDRCDHGFVYSDDMFNGTKNPKYASGGITPIGGTAGSAGLHLNLGNADDKYILDGISGGWTGNFHLDDASSVEVSLDYRLIMKQFDADECAQVLAKINDGPAEILEEMCGRKKDTGWQTKSFMQSLPAGDHTLTIGGYNNKKTGPREVADIYFDNVKIK